MIIVGVELNNSLLLIITVRTFNAMKVVPIAVRAFIAMTTSLLLLLLLHDVIIEPFIIVALVLRLTLQFLNPRDPFGSVKHFRELRGPPFPFIKLEAPTIMRGSPRAARPE